MKTPFIKNPDYTMLPEETPTSQAVVTAESLLSVLGVVYSHRKTGDGGDMYLTRFGIQYADLLELENWYELAWFEARRRAARGHQRRLPGARPERWTAGASNWWSKTAAWAKTCRWKRARSSNSSTPNSTARGRSSRLSWSCAKGNTGRPTSRCNTQEPLAIYVPPEKMQIWQSGRSYEKINRIRARHPGIDIDILRQYKLIYGWIRGKDIQQLFTETGMPRKRCRQRLAPADEKGHGDLDRKGYVMVDMKPSHVIIGEEDAKSVGAVGGRGRRGHAAAAVDHGRRPCCAREGFRSSTTNS